MDNQPKSGENLVEIQVNGVAVPIHRGHQTGYSIKVTASTVPGTNVSPADVLYLLPGYDEISDTQGITLRGGELFKTSAPEGASS